MSTNNLLCDINQINKNNNSCCPDYEADADWCMAFNKRTQDQLKRSMLVNIDGMYLNIQDARNTIGQAEQYLTLIYELLIACLDQVMSVSASTARTVSDFNSASVKIKEFVNEIHLLVGNVQYNGRHLLQDTTGLLRGMEDADFQAGNSAYPSNYPPQCVPHTTLTIPVGTPTTGTIVVFNDGSLIQNVLVGDIMTGDEVVGENVTVTLVDLVEGDVHVTSYQNLSPGSTVYFTTHASCSVDYDIINDTLVYGDTVERDEIHFRFAGSQGLCRTVDKAFNDFVYKLPAVGVHSLGLTSFTSKGGQDYYIDGLDAWTDDEGIIGPDSINDDDIDETVTDFNCAIKTIGVELDKMRSYRLVLCLREKQIKIYKNGLQRCLETKEKI